MPEYKELEEVIDSVEQIAHKLGLSPTETEKLKQVALIHPMRISPYYLSLIDWNDPDDPIRKMAVPSLEEFNLDGSYDTSGEAENTKMPGLQHKYAETALILATNRCATYCRYCFRKRLVGLPTEEIVKRFQEAADYIAEHEEINNVLISGGDPLVLSNEVIKNFLEALATIDHLSFIRFGSKTPVTLPSRLKDPELLALFKRYSQIDRRLYVVTQFNHPREITPQSISAVSKLMNAGVLLNNQTVLLKGVNDDPETLKTLMNSLVSIGVTPYYVFQCRPVKRVKTHFQVPICEGVRIVEEAKAKCNGHSKRFKYVMSHKTGKIEILGTMNGKIYFKYHEAKDRKNLGKMFKRRVDEKAGWLDDFEEK
ncbi:lysine 2,3-aminomutase [miscellaneous Crenarchaeota group-1 archaeon SG8-32-3]|uniref:Lysine 2,3-aminomutase n=1 Tax=miscellaneous Crenarchaeota group-1 archaeon SG8-32-3 TaxID=1685125 RepID=A0A0M0BRI5_9ARCH|nr:MAG: lysine 2,3-aminomutase [miscellaneous Crenarchaeota group-1 archaeon SG8-32-3]